MQEIQLLNHNYPLYISIWFVVTVFLLWFFRFMSKKMKNSIDGQTKSSLFTITVFLGVPLLLVIIIGPLLFLIGDKNMLPLYRYIWLGLIGIFLIYFIFKQRNKTSGGYSK